ncbi:YiiX family permuted papain-like enzyme [Desulfobacterales bacterium HSG16]|nr:YiiX family permuted papain-like enzyme [Desulfobacterales bacterium HSG16]
MPGCKFTTRPKGSRITIINFLIFVGLLSLFCQGCFDNIRSGLKNGDIIFQTSKSSQSRAIRIATRSKYSHMGIVYIVSGNPFVFEAVQPVKLTPLDKWIQRGENGHFVVKRLKNADRLLTAGTLTKMKKIGQAYKGKDYDLFFEWSDTRMYCSELVWKIYKKTLGIEIGKLQKLSDFDLDHVEVRAKLDQRFKTQIPVNEPVISPARMFQSDLLSTVYSN